MKFEETPLKGSFIIQLDKQEDERGFFARTFCQKEFESHNLKTNFVQCNTSYNKKKGTLRGMHYQAEPFSETKLVRCTRGSIYDVIIDLRKDSETYCKWFAIELSESNGSSLYIPEMFAHGFLTLEDNTEIFYQVSEFYSQEHARVALYSDPKFGIHWSLEVFCISDKDSKAPLFDY